MFQSVLGFSRRVLPLVLVLGVSVTAEAAPTRATTANGLFYSYEAPQEVNGGYQDKIYITTPNASGGYSLLYRSDDPVLMVAIGGGQIRSLYRNASAVRINFKAAPNVASGVDPFNVLLFTDSKFSPSEIETARFKKAMTGAWFSSDLGTMTDRPFFSDEDSNRINYTFSALTSSTSGMDTLKAFIPRAALYFLNGGNAVRGNRALVKSITSGENTSLIVGTAPTRRVGNGRGFVVSMPATFSADLSQTHVAIGLANKPQLYGPDANEVSPKGTKVTLTAFVGNRTRRLLSIAHKRASDTRFSPFSVVALEHGFAKFSVTPSETTTYQFVANGRTFRKTVKIAE